MILGETRQVAPQATYILEKSYVSVAILEQSKIECLDIPDISETTVVRKLLEKIIRAQFDSSRVSECGRWLWGSQLFSH